MNLTTAQLDELRNDGLVKFLLLQLDHAYEAGGEQAVTAKLEMYGLSSVNSIDRESAETLARLWKERG